MKSYWDAFMDEYLELIVNKGVVLRTILKAFYYYSRDNKDEADVIMRTEAENSGIFIPYLEEKKLALEQELSEAKEKIEELEAEVEHLENCVWSPNNR